MRRKHRRKIADLIFVNRIIEIGYKTIIEMFKLNLIIKLSLNLII